MSVLLGITEVFKLNPDWKRVVFSKQTRERFIFSCAFAQGKPTCGKVILEASILYFNRLICMFTAPWFPCQSAAGKENHWISITKSSWKGVLRWVLFLCSGYLSIF